MRLTINDDATRALERYAQDGESASDTLLRAVKHARRSGSLWGKLLAEKKAHKATRDHIRDVFLMATDTPRARYRRITGRYPEGAS